MDRFVSFRFEIQLVHFRIIDVVNVKGFFKLTHSHSRLNYSILENSKYFNALEK